MIFSVPKVLLLLGQPQNGGKRFRPAAAASTAELQAAFQSVFPFSDLPPEPLDQRGLVAVQPATAVIQCTAERVCKTETDPDAYGRISPDFGPRETVGDPDKPAPSAVTRNLANAKPVLARDDPVQNGLPGLLEPERVEKESDTRRIVIPVLKGTPEKIAPMIAPDPGSPTPRTQKDRMAQTVTRNRLPEAMDILHGLLILRDGGSHGQRRNPARGGFHDGADFRINTIICLPSFADRRVFARLPPMSFPRSLVDVTLGDGVVQPEDGFAGHVAQDATRFRPSHFFRLDRAMQIKPYLRRDQLSFIRHGHKSTNYSSDENIAFPVPARTQAFKQHQQANALSSRSMHEGRRRQI